jgi:ATP-binding cassette subfamily B protein
MPVSSGEKDNLGHAFRRLFSYGKRYAGAVIAASVLAVAGAVLNLLGPQRLGEMTDLIQQGLSGTIDLDAIRSIGVVLVVIYVTAFVLSYTQAIMMANVTQRLTQDLGHDMSEKIDRLPLARLDSTPTGTTLSLFTNDVDSVSTSLNQSFSTIVSSLAQIVGSVVMMYATNWQMATAGIAAALVGMAATSAVIKRSQPYFVRQQEALAQVDGQVDEVIGALDVVRTCNGKEHERSRFSTLNDALEEANWKSGFLSMSMQPLMIFIGNLAYVVVCVVGGAFAIEGAVSFGVVVAFMIYVRLFTQPLQSLSQAATSVQTLAAACERVFDFLDERELPSEDEKTKSLGRASGDVEFDHVRFGYSADREVIHDFSAHVRPGQKAAIVGPTGAGKTTLVNLLERFYEVDGGAIRIDGTSTSEVTREDVHDQFAMVLQDTWFFSGTLRENIAFDTPGITDEELAKACEACGLSDYVASLPKGLDTELRPDDLSAGQRQLITIARAMVKNAPVLILDEATSSVDTRTELRVQAAMDALAEGRTSFVIAHRLSTVRDADLILYLEDGDVHEQGTHEELLAANGRYAALYRSQFDNGKEPAA